MQPQPEVTATCCAHFVSQHSDVSGCLQCFCAWLQSADGKFTVNPDGKLYRRQALGTEVD